jgi:hypothetical protein
MDFEDKHNHPLAMEDQSAYVFSHRRMTDSQKADVVGYGIGGQKAPWQSFAVGTFR